MNEIPTLTEIEREIKRRALIQFTKKTLEKAWKERRSLKKVIVVLKKGGLTGKLSREGFSVAVYAGKVKLVVIEHPCLDATGENATRFLFGLPCW